jgi:DNA-binding MarR family transcriptional regulator
MQSTDKVPRADPSRTTPASIDPPWHGAPTAIARRFHQLCAARTSEAVGEHGLTPLQYGALVHLSRQAGQPGVEQNAFADRLSVDRNTASLVVEQLAKKGLVERQVNGADRRARLLNLTPKGEKLYARVRPAFLAVNESILAPITPRDRKLLIDLLIRVIEGNLTDGKRGIRRRNRSSRTVSGSQNKGG